MDFYYFFNFYVWNFIKNLPFLINLLHIQHLFSTIDESAYSSEVQAMNYSRRQLADHPVTDERFVTR